MSAFDSYDMLAAEMRDRLAAKDAEIERLRKDFVEAVGKWTGWEVRAERAEAERDAERTETRKFLEKLFGPAHQKGCLWLDDNRMPCQCGCHDRIREAERLGRAMLARLAALPTPNTETASG